MAGGPLQQVVAVPLAHLLRLPLLQQQKPIILLEGKDQELDTLDLTLNRCDVDGAAAAAAAAGDGDGGSRYGIQKTDDYVQENPFRLHRHHSHHH